MVVLRGEVWREVVHHFSHFREQRFQRAVRPGAVADSARREVTAGTNSAQRSLHVREFFRTQARVSNFNFLQAHGSRLRLDGRLMQPLHPSAEGTARQCASVLRAHRAGRTLGIGFAAVKAAGQLVTNSEFLSWIGGVDHALRESRQLFPTQHPFGVEPVGELNPLPPALWEAVVQSCGWFQPHSSRKLTPVRLAGATFPFGNTTRANCRSPLMAANRISPRTRNDHRGLWMRPEFASEASRPQLKALGAARRSNA